MKWSLGLRKRRASAGGGAPSQVRRELVTGRLVAPRGLRLSRCAIRIKLAFIFLVVGALPLAVYVTNSILAVRQSTKAHVEKQAQGAADAFAAALVTHERAVLDQIAINALWNDLCWAVDRRDVAWLEANATAFVTVRSAMDGAAVMSPTGEIISSAGSFHNVSLGDVPVVAAARLEHTSGVDVQLIGAQLYIVGAGPIVEEQGANPPIHGTLIFGRRLNGAFLEEIAACIGAQRLELYCAGRSAASSNGADAGARFARIQVNSPVLSGSRVLAVTELRDGSGDPQARLAVQLDGTSIREARSTLLAATARSGGLAIVIALIAAIVVARMVCGPLRHLRDAARAIAAGGADRHVHIRSRDEFGEVAEAFNHMSNQLTEAFAELRQHSETDSLTGLANHRLIRDCLNRELARAERHGLPFSVVMVDVDGFKPLNDTYGHPVGDLILRRVGELLQAHTRASDVVGRYGGDEFIIVLTEIGRSDAMALARRLRSALVSSPCAIPSGETVPVRASFGVACYPEDGTAVQDLIARADANLYISKRRGGDAVTGKGDLPQGELGNRSVDLLTSLVAAVDVRDRYTRRHSERVTELAVALGAALGVSEAGQRELRLAGLLHDVGRIAIPDTVLRKPGRLSAEEMEIVKRHPVLSETIIAAVPNTDEVCASVVAHHERYDGSGYPRGLAGAEIPLLGRVLAIADAYAAMTTDRPYRAALRPEDAMAELRACAGTQFDPDLVEPFIAVLRMEDTVEVAAPDADAELAGDPLS